MASAPAFSNLRSRRFAASAFRRCLHEHFDDEPLEAQIKAWLEEEPALSAASVLQRLTNIDPSHFKERNLRMVLRLVKACRM